MPVYKRSLMGMAVALSAIPLLSISAQDLKQSVDAADSGKGLILEEPPALFIPAHPDTLERRKQVEMAELYAAARAHESRREWNEALEILDQCYKLDPENVAVLKRLSRLNLALGRMDPGVNFAKKALAIEPDNAATLRLVVSYYERRNQFALAEKLLDEALANPKLSKKSTTALYAHFARGLLYAGRLQQPEKAGDELQIVMDLLDDKAIANDPTGESARILGNNPGNLYMNFGRIFVAIKRWDQAARAFDRGSSYNPDDTAMPVLLVTSLIEADKKEEALSRLQAYLRRSPAGREPYELFVRLMTDLKRSDEITGQLESYNKQNPENPGILGVLADRYRDAGDNVKAKSYYDTLARVQPDPQGFGALAAALIKDKKFDGFLDLMARALIRPGGLEVIRPHIESLAVNKPEASAVIEAAVKRLSENPKAFQRPMYNSLFYLARRADLFPLLIQLQTLAVKAEPVPDRIRELAVTYYENGQYSEAAATIKEL
ncbi:MAG: Beta-barrel assembly-enhancing protease, partial [Planctomycetota bacterium]